MDISNTLWSGILGLFGCCGVIRKQSRENPQEESYQPPKINLGPSTKSISAEILDSKSGLLRILDQVIPEDGKDLETYYIIQHERRSEEKIVGSPYVLNKLWFKRYRVSRTEMIRSSIGRDLLVEHGLQLSPPNSSSCLKTMLLDSPGSAQLHVLDSVIMKLT